MQKDEIEEKKACKVVPSECYESKLRPLSESINIDLTTDSEENNFEGQNDGILKPTTTVVKESNKVKSPYCFDRDDLILITLENFYKYGILPLVKTLKRELSCHHGRFVELMVRSSFNRSQTISRQLFNCIPNLYTTMIIKQKDIIIGLDKVIQNIDELELDCPYASLKTLHLIKFLINTGVLYETYLKMLPHVFYEYVIRNYYHMQEMLCQYSVITDEVQELILFSDSYRENTKELLKEVMVYRETCQEVIDVLYKNKDSEKILDGSESYLFHEFLLLYIQRSIFGSLTYVLKVSDTLEELMYKIPKSYMEMTFIRLLGSIPKSFSESPEAQELLCIFLARSIIDGLISSSFIRGVNRTMKWIKYNKNCYRFKEQGAKLIINFPSETIMNRRVKILALVINFLRTGEGIQFPQKLEEIDKHNVDIIFTLKTLVTRFLSRENGLVYKMAQIFALLATNGQIGKAIVRIVINDTSKVIHLIKGYGIHSERNLQKLKYELREEGLL